MLTCNTHSRGTDGAPIRCGKPAAWVTVADGNRSGMCDEHGARARARYDAGERLLCPTRICPECQVELAGDTAYAVGGKRHQPACTKSPLGG